MYVRSDPQRLKDGTVRRYISLAHNVWVEGPTGKKRTKPVIFARLGVEEELDEQMVKSARDALDRYLQKRFGRMEAQRAEVAEQAAAQTAEVVPALRVLSSREYGLRVIVEAAWKRLGLDKALAGFARLHDVQFDFERVVFAMVFNRLVDPQSKRACNEWVKEGAWFPEAEGWQVQHFYRALDVLEQHETELLTVLRRAVRDRLSKQELELLLIDTTSSYFHIDSDDAERAELASDWEAHRKGEREAPGPPEPADVNDPPLRLRGHSKDHRPDKPQIVIGFVATTSGRIVSHGVFPGNRNDQTIAPELIRLALDVDPDVRPVVVMDSGMSGGPNLAAIDGMDRQPDRITGVPVRNSRFAEDDVLSRPGRWRAHPDKPHFQYRVVEVDADGSPSGRPELWIATRNQREAERVKRKLSKQVERVRAVLAGGDVISDHNRAVCNLLANRALKRFVRTSSDGRRLLLDQLRIKKEQRLAGVKVIRSTLVDHEPIVSLRAYESLLRVEDGFRTFKGPLRLRPMHHRASRRIRAHVLVCALALACLQELEQATGRRFEQLRKLFGPVKAVQMEQGPTRFWQRGEWSGDAATVLTALDLGQGSRTWGAERAVAPA